MKQKLLFILALLCLTVSSAWATDWYKVQVTVSGTLMGNPIEEQTFTHYSTLPYEKTLGECYQVVTGSAPSAMLSVTNVELTSGDKVSIGDVNGWDTSITITDACDATVTATLNAGTVYFAITATQVTSWESGDCTVLKDGGKLIVKKTDPSSETGAMADYSYPSVSPWDDYYASLTSVVIEDGVTSIGERAFRYLTKVTTISLGSDVTTIGKSAFQLCKGLTSVTIPNNVTNIDEHAFDGCENLETLSFGSGVARIGNWAFQGCTSLSSINLPDNLTIIGDEAFRSCNNAGFTSIDIPASVTYIGQYTFYGCSNLTTITLNSNPQIYIDAAFPSGANVTMNLTATVRANREYWMTFYTAHNNYQVPAGTQIFKAELSEDKLTIRELTTDKIVTEGNAVILKSETASITLTRTTSASSNDFSGNSLSGVFKAEGKEVTESTTYALNSGAQGVGFYKVPTGNTIGVGNAYVTSTSTSDFLPFVTILASGYCGDPGVNNGEDVTYSLTDTGILTISGTGAMADYGWNWETPSPFYGNENITSVVIEEGVTHLGDKAFAGCSNLATVSLPSTLKSIGENVFFSCSNLESFTVAAGNTYFASENGLLYNAAKTTALVCPAKKGGVIALPATVTTLAANLFNGNTSITSLDMSACTGLTTISRSLCYGCTALQTVTLPASVTVIDEQAFKECSALTTINLSDCTALTMIRLSAFSDCSLLEGTLTLPNTVTCIGTSAFGNCAKLEELVIQSKLATFKADPDDIYAKDGFGKAFNGCTLLKLNVTDTDLAKAILSSDDTEHYWHKYAYMLKTMPFTISGVTLSPVLNDIKATIDMTSSTTIEIANDVVVTNVSITRTLVPDQACTVMLPFATTRQFIGGGTFYTFTGVEFDTDANKWKATMSEIPLTGAMAANTPYLLVPSSTTFESEISNSTSSVTLNTTTNDKQTVVGDWTFKGVYAEKTWAAADCGNDYGFAATSGKATDGVTDVAAGDFVKLAAGAHIKPMRSYLTYTGSGNPWAAGARSLDANGSLPQSISVVLVGLNGETTEIGTITPTVTEGNGAWYSLDGIRLNGEPTKKGLYINNGKKVVIK